MNDKAIANLRTDSLGRVLVAARHRRIRRRATTIVGGIVLLVIAGVLLGPGLNPARRFGHRSQTNTESIRQLDFAPSQIIRTTTGSVSRISTATQPSIIRLQTPRAAAVQRIDTPTLAGFFPGNGIAIIHSDAKPSRAVFFLTSTEVRTTPH